LQKNQQRTQTINQYIIEVTRKDNPETVGQLIKLVQQKYPLSKREVTEHILHLQNQRKLVLKEHPDPLPRRFESYLLTKHAMWYWTIIALAAATTTLVFTIPENAYPTVYARHVLGSIFVLFLPGYSFIKALFPRNVPIPTSSEGLDNIERIALSIGMSLALVPITGLLLNYTPWGIRQTPVTISLLGLTATFATTAIIREHKNQTTKKPD